MAISRSLGAMRTEVSRLQKHLATTTVYVTHDQTEAMTLGDRVAVVRAGRIQQVGRPQERLQEPPQPLCRRLHRVIGDELMPARFEDSLLRSKLGDMPISGEMRLRLGNPNDRNVILGVRPENFEDASFVPEHDQGHGMTFSATIDVVESMGSDLFVYFALEGGPARSAELDELAVDSGRADTGSDGDQIVARLDAATQIREGETARLWVDVRAVHVFDINSGENLTHPQRVMSAAVVGT